MSDLQCNFGQLMLAFFLILDVTLSLFPYFGGFFLPDGIHFEAASKRKPPGQEEVSSRSYKCKLHHIRVSNALMENHFDGTSQ